MKNQFQTTLNNNINSEDTDFAAQKKAVYKAFKEPSTMLMVSIETGVLRANICRYVAEFEKSGTIRKLHKAKCKVSKRKAGYYTTDEKLVNGL